MKLRKDGRKKADFRELSMNEKLREEREFDCETAIGSQKLATFPKGGKQEIMPAQRNRRSLPKRESKRLHQRQKLKIETIRCNPL